MRKHNKIIDALIHDFIKYSISPHSILLINEYEYKSYWRLKMRQCCMITPWLPEKNLSKHFLKVKYTCMLYSGMGVFIKKKT